MSVAMKSQGLSGVDMKDRPIVDFRMNKAQGCYVEIFVNDVSLMNNRGYEMTINVPINQWVRSGKNEMSVEITPNRNIKELLKAGVNCEVDVGIRVSKAPRDMPGILQPPFFYFGNLVYHARGDKVLEGSEGKSAPAGRLSSKEGFLQDEKGDIVVGEIKKEEIEGKYGKGIKLTRTIEMPLPFPEWKWFSGDSIPNTEATKKELIQIYLKIWQLLHEKKVAELTKLPGWKESTQEMGQAFYMETSKADGTEDLREDVNNPDMVLGGAIPGEQYVDLQVFGHGHLAQIVMTTDKGAVIFFNDKENTMSSNYPFVFYKKNGQWILTR